MATITLRVDDSVRDQLQALAEGNGESVSDLIRSLIDGLFDPNASTRRKVPGRIVVPESISAVDRKQLSLLHKILARLVESDSDDERLGEDGDTRYQLDRAQAMEEGWAKEYDMEFYAMEPELSRRDCGMVMDILDMFRILKYSLEKVGDKVPEEDGYMLEFAGFDLSDDYEGRLLSYARWLVSDERWQEQAHVFSDENDRGNSHVRSLPAYLRMLDAYQAIRRASSGRTGLDQYLLSAKELREIATAGTHPSVRR